MFQLLSEIIFICRSEDFCYPKNLLRNVLDGVGGEDRWQSNEVSIVNEGTDYCIKVSLIAQDEAMMDCRGVR